MDEPDGGLTLLFTDIEGSTALVRELKGSYGLALRVHRGMLERCVAEQSGTEFGSEGDALFFVFATAGQAVAAAVAAQLRIEQHEWPDGVRLRVRIGVHTGPVTISGGEYVGLTVHEVSRICAVAHGGQILCSEPAAAALADLPPGAYLRDLGAYVLRGFAEGRRLFQVCAEGLDHDFPVPRDSTRHGGVRVSMWFRDEEERGGAAAEPGAAAPGRDELRFESVAGGALGAGVDVEILRSARPEAGAFRLVVHHDGAIEEEFDGLTMGGPTDAATIVNAHSRLVRIRV